MNTNIFIFVNITIVTIPMYIEFTDPGHLGLRINTYFNIVNACMHREIDCYKKYNVGKIIAMYKKFICALTHPMANHTVLMMHVPLSNIIRSAFPAAGLWALSDTHKYLCGLMALEDLVKQ